MDEFSKLQRLNVSGVQCGTVHFWLLGLNQEQMKFSNFVWYLKLQGKFSNLQLKQDLVVLLTLTGGVVTLTGGVMMCIISWAGTFPKSHGLRPSELSTVEGQDSRLGEAGLVSSHGG